VALRARLRPDARRDQLLALGVRHFTGRPYEDVSLDEIAVEAGISKGLVYHYYPTKRDFYVAALREATRDMLALVETDPRLPPDEQLRIGLAGYLDYVRAHAPAYRAVLRGGVGGVPEVAKIAEDFRSAIQDRVLAGLGGEPPRSRQRLAVRAWIGLVEAASLDWIEHQDLPAETVVEMLAGALMELL
jgi:AcrR family transcriptional regulator